MKNLREVEKCTSVLWLLYLLTPIRICISVNHGGSLGSYQIQQNWKTNSKIRKHEWNTYLQPFVECLFTFRVGVNNFDYCLPNVACPRTSYDFYLSCPKKGHSKAQGCRKREGPPVLGRTVNPISTRGADYAHHSTTSPLPGFSDLATALKLRL